PSYAETQLEFLKEQLQQRARACFPHDVVLIYFQGGEATNARGEFLELTSGRTRKTVLGRRQLERKVNDIQGVQVLLLDVRARDVEREAQEERSALDVPRYAWYRYAWLSDDFPPQDVRLLSALEDVLKQYNRLGQVKSQLEARRSQLLGK